MPNLYLNIGLHPYKKLKQLKLEKIQNGFPDLSDLKSSILSYTSYSKTFETFSVSAASLSEKLLKSYTIDIPFSDSKNNNKGQTSL